MRNTPRFAETSFRVAAWSSVYEALSLVWKWVFNLMGWDEHEIQTTRVLIPVVQCRTGYWSTDVTFYCAHGRQLGIGIDVKICRAILEVYHPSWIKSLLISDVVAFALETYRIFWAEEFFLFFFLVRLAFLFVLGMSAVKCDSQGLQCSWCVVCLVVGLYGDFETDG